jgi:S1-C subfamily serine protease
VVLVGLLTLLSAGATYAAVSALIGPGAGSPATASAAPGWLGVDTTSFPLGGGAMVVDVAPGSPAEAAGLQPGDVITQIDNRPVATQADVDSAIAGMHPGQQLEIGYARGPITYTTQATLAARSAANP